MNAIPGVVPFIALPTSREEMWSRTATSAHVHFGAQFPSRGVVSVSLSLLAFCFNKLYADALNDSKNGPITHFVMLHSDVSPVHKDWGSRLIGTLIEHKLAACATLVPIRGTKVVKARDTSTAVELKEGGHRNIKVGEWSGVVTNKQEPGLLINTGCLVIDLKHPAADRLYFHIKDGIRVNPETKRHEAWCEPEDWEMSRMMRRLGMPYGVNCDIKCAHKGVPEDEPKD